MINDIKRSEYILPIEVRLRAKISSKNFVSQENIVKSNKKISNLTKKILISSAILLVGAAITFTVSTILACPPIIAGIALIVGAVALLILLSSALRMTIHRCEKGKYTEKENKTDGRVKTKKIQRRSNSITKKRLDIINGKNPTQIN